MTNCSAQAGWNGKNIIRGAQVRLELGTYALCALIKRDESSVYLSSQKGQAPLCVLLWTIKERSSTR